MGKSRPLVLLAVAMALMLAGLGVWIFRDRAPASNLDNAEQIAVGQRVSVMAKTAITGL